MPQRACLGRAVNSSGLRRNRTVTPTWAYEIFGNYSARDGTLKGGKFTRASSLTPLAVIEARPPHMASSGGLAGWLDGWGLGESFGAERGAADLPGVIAQRRGGALDRAGKFVRGEPLAQVGHQMLVKYRCG